MTRAEIKAAAKQQLGNNIFGNFWMTALLVCLIAGAIEYAAGAIVPGIGAILITGPLAYGVCYVFLKQRRDGNAMRIGEMFYGFTNDFGQIFLIGLLTGVFTLLWSLLFVIPGIVKYYSYSMAYFIKIDNPDLGWRECIDESKKMTSGHKWELFMLDLSFLGWYIVGSICLGIGTLWVLPYHTAAKAIVYEQLTGRSLPAWEA